MAANAPAANGKAYLELFETSGSGGGGGGGKKISFQFNPKELQVVKKAKWESKPTKGNKKAPPPEYIGPEAASMSIEMFFDAYDNEGCDVPARVQELIEACTPTTASESSKTPKPPGVIFGWGKVYFRGYIESVTAKYTRFTPEGKAIRAVCTVALKEFPKDKDKQNPTSGSLAALGSRRVVAGDTLAGIAYREYGDPTLWRAIADANGVDDPMLLAPGRRLLIPAATDAAGYRAGD
jgi:nucleoid-associated protein YgaU